MYAYPKCEELCSWPEPLLLKKETKGHLQTLNPDLYKI